MRSSARRPVVFVAAVVGLAAALTAATAATPAETPKPQLYVLHQERARPDRVQEFEQVTKEWIALVARHRDAMPTFSHTAYAGTDLVYTFAAPIESWAGLDRIDAEFQALASAAGSEFATLWQRGNDTMESWSQWVVALRPELSYAPAQPALRPEEVRWARYEFHYLVSGKEQEALAVAGEFRAAFERKRSGRPYQVFVALSGQELPLLIFRTPARDPADAHAAVLETAEAMREELRPLEARILALTRRLESREAWVRPDLSLPPPPK